MFRVLALFGLFLIGCTTPEKKNVYFSGNGTSSDIAACKFAGETLRIFGQKSQSLSFRFRPCSPIHEGYVFKYRLKNNSDIFVSGRKANAPDIKGTAFRISKLGPYGRDELVTEIIRASGSEPSQCSMNEIDGPNHFTIQSTEQGISCTDLGVGAVSVRLEIKDGLILFQNMTFDLLFDTKSFVYHYQG